MGPHFTNFESAPAITMQPLTELLRRINGQLAEQQEKIKGGIV
jgi:hypothetical protein